MINILNIFVICKDNEIQINDAVVVDGNFYLKIDIETPSNNLITLSNWFNHYKYSFKFIDKTDLDYIIKFDDIDK